MRRPVADKPWTSIARDVALLTGLTLAEAWDFVAALSGNYDTFADGATVPPDNVPVAALVTLLNQRERPQTRGLALRQMLVAAAGHNRVHDNTMPEQVAQVGPGAEQGS